MKQLRLPWMALWEPLNEEWIPYVKPMVKDSPFEPVDEVLGVENEEKEPSTATNASETTPTDKSQYALFCIPFFMNF